MELWKVVGVDTMARDKDKFSGETREGVKLYLVGANFENDDSDRYLGEVVSALFLTRDQLRQFGVEPVPGDQIRVGYNRWGRVSALEPVF